MDLDPFIAAVRQVAAGGTAMDPEVIAALLTRHAADAPLADPDAAGTRSPRPDGRGQIQRRHRQRMFITERAVAKHSNHIFAKLGHEQCDEDNRRVLAVLTYLSGEQPGDLITGR